MSIDDDKELQEIVVKLASKPGHENVRAVLYDLLVRGLGVDLNQVHLEKHLKEVRGRMDALLGRTIIEIKSDLNRELKDAEVQLLKYLQEKESGGEAYIGIATDGALFRVYERKNRNKDLTGDSLEIIKEYKTNSNDPRLLLIWLESALALNDKLLPEARVIEMELGRESVFYNRSLKELNRLWQDLRDIGESESETKHTEWKRLLETAYISEIEESDLFLQHSYLTFVAKAIATVALLKQTPANAEDFLSGEAFKKFGIFGAIESDFFNWVLLHDDGAKLVMDIFIQTQKFKWKDIESDILKILYENLINPVQRQELGEYYTPDWLAEKVCRKVITDPLNMRVIDPACGSGTFLFHAIRLVLEKCSGEKYSEGDIVRKITETIFGIDVHPVAVIFARVNYLLALSPLLYSDTVELRGVSIPVYMGNSLQWDIRKDASDKEDLEIVVPALQEADNSNGSIKNNDIAKGNGKRTILRFPASVAKIPLLFDEIMEQIIHFADNKISSDIFSKWLEEKKVSSDAIKLLTDSYKQLCLLQEQKRNHIWGYVARNLSRPIWLAGENQKADIVIGNPPWRSYRKMGVEIQKNFKDEMMRMELWSTKATSTQDFACYCFARAMELYMRKDGRMAFVMPLAVMTRQPHEKFRSGRFLDKKFSGRYFCFTEAWAFPSDVEPLFPVPACVLFAKNANVPKDLPENVTYFSGKLPRRDANIKEASRNLTECLKQWPSGNKIRSEYGEKFRQGAIFIPRRFCFIERISSGLQTNKLMPLVKGKSGKGDNEPWKSLKPPTNPVEVDFIYPIYKGSSIAPYRILIPEEGVVAWSSKYRQVMNSQFALQSGYEGLSKWLSDIEKKWEKHKSGNEKFEERVDHFKSVTKQFPVASIRVVYATSGSQPAATILKDKKGLVDTSLYWTQPESIDEAYYLIALLNSETARAAYEKWQAEGQQGKRHFAKAIFNLSIPNFDNENSLHQKLVAAAKTAEKIANKTTLREGLGFKANRLDIRNALSEHGIADDIDRLVAELLAVNS